MADASVNNRVADWVREHALPERFGQDFLQRAVRLTPGGSHRFGAVSMDGRLVGTINTGSAQRSNGGLAIGTVNKIRADLFFLLITTCEIRFVAVVEPSLHHWLLRERDEHRRIPPEVQIILVDLPIEFKEDLARARQVASDEVSPS